MKIKNYHMKKRNQIDMTSLQKIIKSKLKNNKVA